MCVHEGGANWEPSRGAWVGGWQELLPHAATMSLDGHSDSLPITGLSDVELRRVDYIAVFPNLLLSLHPDYVLTYRMIPLSAGRTFVECLYLFPVHATEQPTFDPAFAMDFWDITNREDWAALESVYRGLDSGFAKAGPLMADEEVIYRFVTMVARGYSGLPISALANIPTTNPSETVTT